MNIIRRTTFLAWFDKEEFDCYLSIVSKISVFRNTILDQASENHILYILNQGILQLIQNIKI